MIELGYLVEALTLLLGYWIDFISCVVGDTLIRSRDFKCPESAVTLRLDE